MTAWLTLIPIFQHQVTFQLSALKDYGVVVIEMSVFSLSVYDRDLWTKGYKMQKAESVR